MNISYSYHRIKGLTLSIEKLNETNPPSKQYKQFYFGLVVGCCSKNENEYDVVSEESGFNTFKRISFKLKFYNIFAVSLN